MKLSIFQRDFALYFVALFFLATNAFSKQDFSPLNKSSSGFNSSSTKARKYITIGGGYKSDHNSKQYEIAGSYYYKDNKFMHELDFLHEVNESSTTTRPMAKDEELYDFQLNSKMLIGQSRNYFNFYHRTQYDQYSDFYYDIVNAAGIGRLFFKGKLESSINFGYNNVKNFDSGTALIGIVRANIPVSQNIRLSTTGSLIKTEKTYDDEIKNILSFRIEKNLFLEFVHKYQKNRYIDSSKNSEFGVNRVNRSLYVRMKYNF